MSGALTGVRSPFALAVAARKQAQQRKLPLKLMMPKAQAAVSATVPDIAVYGAMSLFEAAAHLVGHGTPMAPEQTGCPTQASTTLLLDMADVIGHRAAKHALLAAAAGQHHIRLVGPPGSGKSMLAQRVGGLLPALPFEDSLDISAIRSLKGEGDAFSQVRPFPKPAPQQLHGRADWRRKPACARRNHLGPSRYSVYRRST